MRTQLSQRRKASPGEFDSVVEGRREQKAVLLSAEGQTSDLFGVDGNILTRFESHSADLLHTEAWGSNDQSINAYINNAKEKNQCGRAQIPTWHQGCLWRGLRRQQAAERLAVGQNPTAPRLRHQHSLREDIMSPAGRVLPLGRRERRSLRGAERRLSFPPPQLLQNKHRTQQQGCLTSPRDVNMKLVICGSHL